jgi:hypothetical protein
VRPDLEAFGDIMAAWRADYVDRLREKLGDEPADAAEVELKADRRVIVRRRRAGSPRLGA